MARGWRSHVALALGLVLWGAGPALAQGKKLPDQSPQLRIEAQMHTAVITRVAVSRDGKLMVTGSEDKTIRLWSVPDGRLMKIFRVPIGPGNDGKVFAVAISPDGRTVAAGGWMESEGREHLYLFDAQSGTVVRRLGPVPSSVHRIQYSPDGRYIGASLGGGAGVKLWDTRTWTLAFEDKEYGAVAYGLDFNDQGGFATTSYDGFVRLYSPERRLRYKIKAPSGNHPFGVSFDPGGQRLAIAYEDSPAVDVLSGEDLRRMYAADTRGVTSSNLLSVTFSADGSTLYAGGQFVIGGDHQIMRWGDAGRGPREIVNGPSDTVLDLIPYGKRGIAWGAADPAFAIVGDDGKRLLYRGPTKPDLRRRPTELFLASPDLSTVRFGLKDFATDLWSFDLRKLRLTQSPQPPPGLVAPDVTSLPITDGQNNPNPKIANNPIKLLNYESARSLAIAPDKRSFALGADWRLRRFDSNGRLLWEQQGPGVVWAVQYSADGKLIAAGYGDGTVRWHRASDGTELMALFVHIPENPKDEKRWVLWTPSGYYSASPGGESLIGWLVNRSWDEAPDFFPAHRFRADFYRPDVINQVLDTLDENRGVDAANRDTGQQQQPAPNVRDLAPPVIEIFAPKDGQSFERTEVAFEYSARSPTGERVTEVEVLIDGERLQTRDPKALVPNESGKLNVPLTLPPRNVVVTVVARSGDKASDPVTLKLNWSGPTVPQFAKPKLKALLVGVSDYTNKDLKLKWAAKDAADLGRALRQQVGRGYESVDVRVLPNPKRSEVMDGLEWLEQPSDGSVVTLLFFAGHGITDERNRFFFLPSADAKLDQLRATAVSRDDIVGSLANMPGKRIVLLDACHSADALLKLAGRGPVDMSRITNEIASPEAGVVMYAAAQGWQVSYEDDAWSNGAFTKALVEGLDGSADYNKDGVVETDELNVWLRSRVRELTRNKPVPQEPVMLKSQAVPEFTIAARG